MITSTSNDKVKHAAMLVKNAKARRKEGVFVVEGIRAAGEIPKDRLVECFVSEDAANSRKLSEVFGYDVSATVVSSEVFAKISDTKSPQGILCICRQKKYSASDLLSERSGDPIRLLILESIQDPGNLGTMVRSAHGAGFDAIIADENTVDVYNPKVIRSTMGSLFKVPVIYTPDLGSVVDTLREEGVTVYAAHLDGSNDFRKVDYPQRVAFMIGNEGSGLSDEITRRADMLVKIPMKNGLESLNAAVAASLLMYSV